MRPSLPVLLALACNTAPSVFGSEPGADASDELPVSATSSPPAEEIPVYEPPLFADDQVRALTLTLGAAAVSSVTANLF